MTKTALTVTIVTVLLLPPGAVIGAENIITPSVFLRQEMNDNIFISEDGKLDDLITTISPRLRVLHRTERSEAELSARWDGLIYADNDELNTLEQFYDGSVSHQLNTRSTVSLKGNYARDARPDRDIETTGLVLSNIDRAVYGADAALDYVFTERTGAAVAYFYRQEDYDPEFLLRSEASDLRAHSIYISPRRSFPLFQRPVVGQVSFGYAAYDYIDVLNSSTDYYSVTVGMSMPLHERWELNVNAGGNHVRNTFETVSLDPGRVRPVKSEEKSSGSGTVALASVKYIRPQGSVRVDFSYDIKPSSARGGNTNRTAFELAIDEQITYNFKWFIVAGYYLNRAKALELSRQEVDEETVRFETRFRYRFLDDFLLTAAYNYVGARDHTDGSTKNRNLVYLQVGYDHEWLQ